MKRILFTAFLCILLVAGYAQKSQTITGVYWNDEKTSKIEVKEDNGKYIGTIVYMIPEKYENGQPPKDDDNPNPELRDRPLIGLQILSGLGFDEKEGEWTGGRIYDPKSGKTYDCFAWFEDDPDVLYLKGYVVGIRWLGKSTEWTRTSL